MKTQPYCKLQTMPDNFMVFLTILTTLNGLLVICEEMQKVLSPVGHFGCHLTMSNVDYEFFSPPTTWYSLQEKYLIVTNLDFIQFRIQYEKHNHILLT